MRQLVVDALGDLGGLLHQRLAGRGVETRIGAQRLQELLEGAGVAGLLHRRFHAGADAADLALAERLDLVGGELGGGVVARQPGVVGPPVRQAGGADAGPRGLQVVAGQKRGVGPLLRLHAGLDQRRQPRPQRRLLVGRDGGRQAPERRGEGGVRRRRGRVRRRVPGEDLGLLARQHPAGGDPAPDVGHLGLVIGRDGLDAGEPALGVGDGVDGGHPADVIGDPERPDVGGEGRALDVEAHPLQAVLDGPGEVVAVERVLGRDRGVLERGEPLLQRLQLRLARGHGGGGVVGPARQRVHVAFQAGADRALGFGETVVVGDQPLQVVGRRGPCRKRGEQRQEDGEGRPSAHHSAAWITRLGPARSSSTM